MLPLKLDFDKYNPDCKEHETRDNMKVEVGKKLGLEILQKKNWKVGTQQSIIRFQIVMEKRKWNLKKSI